jgi:hypothetical protein
VPPNSILLQNRFLIFLYIENSDEFTGSARTELSPETVQEFQVVNNGLSAESGGGASGSINVITKSGVNTLHGDAFVFVQNGSLNARDPLTNETEAPELNRFRAQGYQLEDRSFAVARSTTWPASRRGYTEMIAR